MTFRRPIPSVLALAVEAFEAVESITIPIELAAIGAIGVVVLGLPAFALQRR